MSRSIVRFPTLKNPETITAAAANLKPALLMDVMVVIGEKSKGGRLLWWTSFHGRRHTVRANTIGVILVPIRSAHIYSLRTGNSAQHRISGAQTGAVSECHWHNWNVSLIRGRAPNPPGTPYARLLTHWPDQCIVVHADRPAEIFSLHLSAQLPDVSPVGARCSQGVERIQGLSCSRMTSAYR